MINNEILVKGFETCGIHPFDPQKILRKLPDSDENTAAASQTVSQALLSHLQETRHPEKECAKKRKKRVNIEAGKSVSALDLLTVDSEPGTSKSKKKNDVLEEEMPSDDNSESESHDIECESNLNSESATHKKSPVELKAADWVIVEYAGKKQSKKFVGQIIQKKDNFDYLVKFMKQKDKHCFFWPDTEDISNVDYDMIVGVVKEPEIGRRGFLYFEEDI
ncbi:hypothetical protein LOTGIDRAFT_171331 [Lottia gigantea]|uniref:Uncharacterized protein n=1 Tax=Lottia gigantea TaxID=225164 RepID=V4B0F7_LOTGI|nr:hypothetical protein LOTGIDRAFT_171331 [Lottia gigantea]ESP03538.1 hypothetical protein LOTGIDRAFT_171331 [Lottia gigantea]